MPERVRTGSDRVDEVIRAVEELEERPIEEHVGVFESAQVQLRRALDDPGDDGRTGRRATTTTPATSERPARRHECHHAGCGWTPSWSAGGLRGRGSTPPSW